MGGKRQARTENRPQSHGESLAGPEEEILACSAGKSPTEAAAQEFGRLLTYHGAQLPAHADSNGTAHHAAGSGSTDWRKIATRATERPAGIPKGGDAPPFATRAGKPPQRLQRRNSGTPASSTARRGIPRQQRPQPPESRREMSRIPAPQRPGRTFRPQAGKCPSGGLQGLSVTPTRNRTP